MKHEILIYNKSRKKIPEEFIKATITKVLRFLKLKQPVETAVLVVGQAEIRRLNKIWRKKNEVPDELSFGLNSRQTAGLAKGLYSMLSLGEIVINAEKISNKNYLIKILTHSLLHLLGHHHEKSRKEAKEMEQLEKKILNNLEKSLEIRN